jgi:hypothetical protein
MPLQDHLLALRRPEEETQLRPTVQERRQRSLRRHHRDADNAGFSTGDHLHFGLKPEFVQEEQPWTRYNVEQDNGYMGAISPAPYFSKLSVEHAGFRRAVDPVVASWNAILALFRQVARPSYP